jgi:hypothetical protein
MGSKQPANGSQNPLGPNNNRIYMFNVLMIGLLIAFLFNFFTGGASQLSKTQISYDSFLKLVDSGLAK